jgi:hypothetical protein
MKDLVACIAKAIVDNPEEVVVTDIKGTQSSVIELVSIQKWPFSAISVSICGISCATYDLYVSAQSLDLLDFAKNFPFLNWKLKPMPIVTDFHFWMGTR